MAVALCVFLLTFFGTLAVVAFVLVRLPSDYFQTDDARPFMDGWPKPMRWVGLVLKNVFGVLVVLVGVGLSLPGVPGQGLLIILLGLMLVDFPGRRAMIHRIVRIPRIIAMINRVRARFGKAALIVN
jgi:hypothetical protein